MLIISGMVHCLPTTSGIFIVNQANVFSNELASLFFLDFTGNFVLFVSCVITHLPDEGCWPMTIHSYWLTTSPAGVLISILQQPLGDFVSFYSLFSFFHDYWLFIFFKKKSIIQVVTIKWQQALSGHPTPPIKTGPLCELLWCICICIW